MNLDITRHNLAECADKLVDLAGGGTADGIGDTYAVDTRSIGGLVESHDIIKVRSEGVLGRKTDFTSLADSHHVRIRLFRDETRRDWGITS
jgi:hypothetical protein